MEEQAGEQLGVEVGRLLGQRLACLGEAEDVLDARGPDDEGTLGAAAVDRRHRFVDERRVADTFGRQRLDQLDVELSLATVDDGDPPLRPVEHGRSAIGGLPLQVRERALQVDMVRSGAVDVLDDPGLMIFPTHRTVESVNGPVPDQPDLLSALVELERQPLDRAAAVLYRSEGRAALLHGREGELDVQLVESLAPEGVSYTPSVEEAVAAVDSGRAAGAFIVRSTRIEDVFRFAEAGETLPQKTTYFYPKLLSGLLFHPDE